MSSARERSDDIRARMIHDMTATLRRNGLTNCLDVVPPLVEDAMFQVEVLLSEIETMGDTIAAQRRASSVTDEKVTPG